MLRTNIILAKSAQFNSSRCFSTNISQSLIVFNERGVAILYISTPICLVKNNPLVLCLLEHDSAEFFALNIQ